MQSYTEVGAALRSARIALALPLESIARELRVPPAQIKAIEAGSTGGFLTPGQRSDATQRLLIRFSLPESWALLQPAEAEWPVSPLTPGPEIPPLALPKPVTSRQRYLALGAAGVVVATAIGAALIPAAPPVDENELEDLRSSAPSAALNTTKAADAQLSDPVGENRSDAPSEARPAVQQAPQAVKEPMPSGPAPSAASPDQARPSASTGPYAILPGSQLVAPTEAALEIKARAAVAVDLVLGQGATQITMRPGDRVVLMSGRAERVEVSDRNAVELAMAGRAVQLTAVAPPAAGNNPDSNSNRGVWAIAGR